MHYVYGAMIFLVSLQNALKTGIKSFNDRLIFYFKIMHALIAETSLGKVVLHVVIGRAWIVLPNISSCMQVHFAKC